MSEKKMRFWTALMVAALAGWSLLSAQNGGFLFRGPLSRLISPNGDGRNDVAIFCFENFSHSGVSGAIYSLTGREVVTGLPHQNPALAGCPGGSGPESMTWDGKVDGSPVRSGVYVYQIKSEGQAFTGTLLVVR